MQSLNNSLTVRRTRRGRLTTAPGYGPPNPTWIPVGHEAVRRIADHIDGFPGGTVGDVFNIPMTAHILGGAVIGDSPATGVIDPYHRVFGYPTLHVVDGSAVSANLGRQSVADDHREGGARDVVVAQRGGGGSASCAGGGVLPTGRGPAASTDGAAGRAGRAAFVAAARRTRPWSVERDQRRVLAVERDVPTRCRAFHGCLSSISHAWSRTCHAVRLMPYRNGHEPPSGSRLAIASTIACRCCGHGVRGGSFNPSLRA